MKKAIFKITAASILLAALDQLSKVWAIRNIDHIFNNGVAFGIAIPKILLIGSTIALLIGFTIVAFREFKITGRLAQIAMSLIIAGGFSNLLDRFTYGAVVDFINIKIWPIFNIADVYIIVGVVLIVAFYERLMRNPKRSS